MALSHKYLSGGFVVLLSDCYENASPKLENKCKVCVWYETLDDAGKAFFDEKIGVNAEALYRACLTFDTNAGFGVSTLRRHKVYCLSCH